MTTDETSLTLRGVCAETGAAFAARDAAETALASAEAEYTAAAASLDAARALVADPVDVARQHLDPGEVQSRLRKAEEVAYSCEVRLNTRRMELENARGEVRRCAESAAAVAGANARERLKQIHARFDAARAEMESAAREEAEVVGLFRGTLREVFGYERGVGDYAITVKLAA